MAALNPPLRRLLAASVLLMAFVLASCAASAPEAAHMADASTAATTPQLASATAPAATTTAVAPPPAPRSKPAPPMSAPLPPERMPEPGAKAAAKVDTSCKNNAECVIKNVGSCCGLQPACVNVNSPTDPRAVQAACASKGMVSHCGIKPIDHCQCSLGRCQDEIMMVDGEGKPTGSRPAGSRPAEPPPAETR